MNGIQKIKGRRNPEKSRKKASLQDIKNTRAILERVANDKTIKPLIKNKTICPLIEFGKTINEGSFGIVSELKKPKFTIPVIIKKIKAKPKNVEFGSEIFTETVIGSLLASEYNKGNAINYPRLISSFICDGEAHTISEQLSGSVEDFRQIMGRKLNNDDVHNILFQLLAAVHFAQKKYLFMHRDLHPSNWLLQRIDKGSSVIKFQGKDLSKVKNFIYDINGTLYKIPNKGYLVKLIDFGTSSVQWPVRGFPRNIAQNIVLKRSWNGLFNGNWGNFGPTFEQALDPIFMLSSILLDPPINSIVPQFIQNKIFQSMVKDVFDRNKTGYLSSKEVSSRGPNDFPLTWWTLTDAGGLRRPFGTLPNDKLSPSQLIENYLSMFKFKKARKDRKRFTTISFD